VRANWTLGIGGADSTSRTEESAAMTGSRDSSKRRDSAFPERRIRRSTHPHRMLPDRAAVSDALRHAATEMSAQTLR